MTWFTIEAPHHRHAIREIEKQRDRGAGIIAVSILEEHLTAAITSRFDRNPDLEGKLFKGTGPLSSLSAKIDLGLLLGIYTGIYTKDIHESLHIIREIRNDFAHNSSPASFTSQRDRCAKLAFPKGTRRAWNALLKKGDLRSQTITSNQHAHDGVQQETPRSIP